MVGAGRHVCGGFVRVRKVRDRQDAHAVLIDADNMPAKYAEAVLKEAGTIGEPALRRVYGDWSSDLLKSWVPRIRELGLVAHQASANTRGKNASDIQLVIDAMDILHTGRFDGFVLVSSDSDFTALAGRLRENGLMVVGIVIIQTEPFRLQIREQKRIVVASRDAPEAVLEGARTRLRDNQRALATTNVVLLAGLIAGLMAF